MAYRLNSLTAGCLCLLFVLPVAARAQQGSSFPSIPNLLARWEPSQNRGAYADTAKTKPAVLDGTSVAVIADLSGNGYDMIQPASGSQGLYKTAGSFKPGCVRFNGVGSTYSAGSPPAFNALASGGYTVFLVYEELSGQGTYGSILSKQSTGSGPFSFLTLNSGTQFARYNGQLSTGAFTPANTFTLNSPSFLVYQFAPINLNSINGAPPAIFGSEKLWNNEASIYDVAQQGDQWLTSNNVRLGSNDTPSFFVNGDIAAVIVYSSALSDSQVSQVESYLARRYHLSTGSGSGHSKSLLQSRIMLHATGNSIMAGYLTQSNSPVRQAVAKLSWQPYAVYNEAIGGEQTTQMTLAASGREDKFVTAGVVNALFAWEGSNDINAGSTGDTAYSNMVTYLTDRHTAGFSPTFAFTVLPRGTSSTFEAQRQIYNNLLKSDFTTPVSGYPGLYAANAGVTYADYLVDIGSDATIGAPNAQFMTQYYCSDATHLNATGAGYAATNYFAPAFNLVYAKSFGGIPAR